MVGDKTTRQTLPRLVDTILVPRGAEYRAVLRGVGNRIPVIPIPLGDRGVREFLQGRSLPPKVLLMGLCGSLSPHYSIGDAVVYRECCFAFPNGLKTLQCSVALTDAIARELESELVTGWTSDRFVASASEKRQRGALYGAEVVDMEGYGFLAALAGKGTDVAMLRVVSDDCDRDLPDLNAAISAEGQLHSLTVASCFLQQPIAAFRLIAGSLQGLKRLEAIASD